MRRIFGKPLSIALSSALAVSSLSMTIPMTAFAADYSAVYDTSEFQYVGTEAKPEKLTATVATTTNKFTTMTSAELTKKYTYGTRVVKGYTHTSGTVSAISKSGDAVAAGTLLEPGGDYYVKVDDENNVTATMTPVFAYPVTWKYEDGKTSDASTWADANDKVLFGDADAENVPDNPTRTGYDFGGWDDISTEAIENYTKVSSDDSTKDIVITKATTYQAVWNPRVVIDMTSTAVNQKVYDVTDGSEIAVKYSSAAIPDDKKSVSLSVTNKTVDLTSTEWAKYSLVGYKLIGFSETQYSTTAEYQTSGTYTITEAKPWYPVWKAIDPVAVTYAYSTNLEKDTSKAVAGREADTFTSGTALTANSDGNWTPKTKNDGFVWTGNWTLPDGTTKLADGATTTKLYAANTGFTLTSEEEAGFTVTYDTAKSYDATGKEIKNTTVSPAASIPWTPKNGIDSTGKVNVKKNATITMPTAKDAVLEGYTLVGWKVNDSTETTLAPGDQYTVRGAVTVSAMFDNTGVAVLTFDMDNGAATVASDEYEILTSGSDYTISAPVGTEIDLSKITVTLAGKALYGYGATANKKTIESDAVITLSEAKTIFPIFETEWTVSYYSADATALLIGDSANKYKQYTDYSGVTVTESKTTTVLDYPVAIDNGEFVGWYNEAGIAAGGQKAMSDGDIAAIQDKIVEAGEVFDFADAGNQNVVFYPVYRTYQTIEYVPGNKTAQGTNIESVQVLYGDDVTLSENTYTVAGKAFRNWTVNANNAKYNGKDIYANATSVKIPDKATLTNVIGDLVLTGEWGEPDTFTVTFISNGGTGTMAAQTVTEQVAATLTKNSFKAPDDNLEFAGWSLTADGAVEYEDEASTANIDKDMNLYAQWTVTAAAVEAVVEAAEAADDALVDALDDPSEDTIKALEDAAKAAVDAAKAAHYSDEAIAAIEAEYKADIAVAEAALVAAELDPENPDVETLKAAIDAADKAGASKEQLKFMNGLLTDTLETAKAKADEAKDEAVDAQKLAEQAAKDAKEAEDLAKKAQEKAEGEKANAVKAKELAEQATAKAEQAKELAEKAQKAAEDKATTDVAAAQKAQQTAEAAQKTAEAAKATAEAAQKTAEEKVATLTKAAEAKKYVAKKTVVTDDKAYTVRTYADGTAMLKKVANAKGKVTLPSKVKVNDVQYKVTKLAAKAFYNNKTATQVIVPASYTQIGALAFGSKNAGTSKCKKITIKGANVFIGQNAFKNLPNKKTTKIVAKNAATRKQITKFGGQGKNVKVTKK